MSGEQKADRRCLCYEFVRVTEQAALAAGRWMGQGETGTATFEAGAAMVAELDAMPIAGSIVIGREDPDVAGGLTPGRNLGTGGREYDLAVDPLQAANSLTRGQGGAISVLAAAGSKCVMSAPNIYMQKLVVGSPVVGHIDIEAPVSANLKAIAAAYERKVNEITVILLDRPRHEELIAEIRRAGARIKLIPDGDITAGIAAAVGGTGDHAYIGIGGTAEGIITAAAMRCLGGEIQAKFWPLSRKEVRLAQEHGIDDIEVRLRTDDMVSGDVIFAATGVTRGEFLRGVDYFPDGARSHTLIMCTRCRQVRFVDTIHLFSDNRHEIRL